MNNSLPQGNPGSSDCVGSAASHQQPSTRIIPIMTAPSPSIGPIQQRQDASEQHPHPQTSEAHLQSSGAQLVAFHTEHERRPPEGPQRKYDATSRQRAADATTAPLSEMEMDCRRPLAGQQPQKQQHKGKQRHHKQPEAFWSSDGSGNTSSAEGKAVEDVDSGGSGQTRRSSNPEDWFNSLNINVAGGNQNFANYDNDSPYYVARRRPDGPRHSRPKPLRAPFDPLPQGLHIPAGSIGESNSESFRSVIDDLTVKNQKLKERLRRIKGFQGKGAQGEKLFEVRIHDLPEHKKHELDQLLKNFSASLENTSPENDSGNNITPPDQSVAPPDSGYASLPRNQSPAGVASSSGSKSSDPLRPWPSNTELAKMKLVVARLEQLFTGSDTAHVDRSQLLKQQDISNSAADDDRRAALAAGHRELYEGAREAAMMDGHGIVSNESGNNSGTDKRETSTESPEGFEQRPTRPMDLDPGRRQVPQDNIEYLTHITESSTQGPEMGNGWVFLNLIINLAQLHTINVTPPFVKKAINTVSTRLELSSDGRMVRWNTKDQESSGSNSGSAQSEEGSGSGYPGSGEKDSSKNSSSGCGFGAAQQSGDSSHESKFHYKPLFGQLQFFDDDSSSAMTSSDSDARSPSDEYGNGSGRNAGPIIYYKGGNFCTDLSSAPVSKNPLPSYKRMTDRPLGIPEKCPESPGSKRESPLHQYTIPSESTHAMDIETDAPSIRFSPEFTATYPSTPVPPIEFEASGVGGVLPADNFAITCQTRHYLHPTTTLPVSRTKTYRSKLHRKLLHRIPQRALNSFYEPDQPPPTSQIRHEILSAETTRLPPSSLPPASYFIPYTSSSSSDFASEDSDDVAPRSYGSEDYFGTGPIPSSGDDEKNPGVPVVAGFMKRSPSSTATAGDESRPESLLVGVEEPTFEMPLRLEESEGSGSAVEVEVENQGLQQQQEGRPSLKRHRNMSGSVKSSGGVARSGKSQKMMDGLGAGKK
ncbi:hypothetical protein EX30DRAFT_396528 [Ascodesmis nigricans]|uniref:Frequency clock protein n=1 Tax=Ascodesmis nigricans TaxID=341454 RepID=A0A4S2MUP9_9PEZI|nr:hypothetical protein EX30DRAFT_396528 [Ascodesmis nigricans]